MKLINFKKLKTEEWDWLVGFYLADGSRAYENPRTYRIYFYLNPSKDKQILKKLLKIFSKLGIRAYIKYQRKLNTLFVKLIGKQLFKSLPKKTKIFKPTNIDAFIAGFLDGDGYISIKKKCIGFSQSVVKWIGPFISKYLKSLNIKPWEEVYYRNAFYFQASLKQIKTKTHILNFMAKNVDRAIPGARQPLRGSLVWSEQIS